MRPVFEDCLVDVLSLVQMCALISGDARMEDMVVAALDHVDRVDLHVAEMLDGEAGRLGPVAERRGRVEPLGVQPDAFGSGFRDRVWFGGSEGHGQVKPWSLQRQLRRICTIELPDVVVNVETSRSTRTGG